MNCPFAPLVINSLSVRSAPISASGRSEPAFRTRFFFSVRESPETQSQSIVTPIASFICLTSGFSLLSGESELTPAKILNSFCSEPASAAAFVPAPPLAFCPEDPPDAPHPAAPSAITPAAARANTLFALFFIAILPFLTNIDSLLLVAIPSPPLP